MTAILSAHGWHLEVMPTLGGSITRLDHRDNAVLRPAMGVPESPLDCACFPLVPYANRIAEGRFSFGGKIYALPRNFGDHPHSLHGVGWQAAWAVGERRSDAIRLQHDHVGDARWPWSYRAEQMITLEPDCCRIELRVTQMAPDTVPLGIGLHPYLPAGPTTALRMHARSVWLSDSTLLPNREAPVDHFGAWGGGALVAGNQLIDNCYAGWSGNAVITQPWGSIEIDAIGADNAHLYRPSDEPYFCIEPVSHLPNAINCGGMPLVPSGGQAFQVLTLRPQY